MTMISTLMSILRTLVAVVGILVILVTVLVVIAVVMHGVRTVALVDPAILLRPVTQPLGDVTPDLITIVNNRDLQCEACKRVGHAATTCDILAQALFITKYMKYTLDDKAKANLEAAWLDCWSCKLGTPSHSPRTVMQAYLNDMDLTLNDLDAQMCWDCWPNDDMPFAEVKTADST